MYLFNRWPQLEFHALTMLTAGGMTGAVLLVIAGMKFIFRKETQRILNVLHFEYVLLLTAIFLPVAAHAKLIPSGETFDFREPLLLFLAFAAVVIMFTVIFYIAKNRKKGKLHVNRNTNS